MEQDARTNANWGSARETCGGFYFGAAHLVAQASRLAWMLADLGISGYEAETARSPARCWPSGPPIWSSSIPQLLSPCCGFRNESRSSPKTGILLTCRR